MAGLFLQYVQFMVAMPRAGYIIQRKFTLYGMNAGSFAHGKRFSKLFAHFILLLYTIADLRISAGAAALIPGLQ